MKNSHQDRTRNYFERHATPVQPPDTERQMYLEKVWRIIDNYIRVIENATRVTRNSKLRFREAVDY